MACPAVDVESALLLGEGYIALPVALLACYPCAEHGDGHGRPYWTAWLGRRRTTVTNVTVAPHDERSTARRTCRI